MSLNIDQLRYFVAVAEAGSFTSAARKLGKAQSTISEAINAIEIECGVELFDRSQKRPPLTEAGLSLLREARSVIAAYESFSAKARGFNEGEESRLTFAYDPIALPHEFMMTVLNEFQREYPYVELEILAVDTKDVLDLVTRGRADMGLHIFQGFSKDAIEAHGVGNTHLVQVAATNHPLNQLTEATVADLQCYHKLATTNLSSQEPLRHSSVTNRLWYLNSMPLLMDLLNSGFGWALLPIHLIGPLIRSGELTRIKLAEQTQPISFAVTLSWHREYPMGPAAKWLREALSNLPVESNV